MLPGLPTRKPSSLADSELLLPQRRHRGAVSDLVRLPRRRMLPHAPSLLAFALRLPTARTRALAPFARARTRLALTVTGRLPIRTFRHARLLHVRQSPRLRVDIAHLLVAHGVEAGELLPGGRPHGLLEITVQRLPHRGPRRGRFVGDAVAGVETFGSIGRVVLLVEVLEGGGEAGGDAVFVVEGDGFLDGAVGEDVAVREVLGYDAGAGLVLLGDGVIFGGGGNGFFGGGGGGGGEVADGGSGGDVDLRGPQLGVIEEEGGLGSAGEEVSWEQNISNGVEKAIGKLRVDLRFLLKGHGCRLGAVWGIGGWGDGEGGDFSTDFL